MVLPTLASLYSWRKPARRTPPSSPSTQHAQQRSPLLRLRLRAGKLAAAADHQLHCVLDRRADPLQRALVSWLLAVGTWWACKLAAGIL